MSISNICNHGLHECRPLMLFNWPSVLSGGIIKQHQPSHQWMLLCVVMLVMHLWCIVELYNDWHAQVRKKFSRSQSPDDGQSSYQQNRCPHCCRAWRPSLHHLCCSWCPSMPLLGTKHLLPVFIDLCENSIPYLRHVHALDVINLSMHAHLG